MTERSPYEELIDERLEALVERDWPRYNQAGQRLLELVLERKAINQAIRGDDHERGPV